jgi:hypothetical protein
VWTCWCPREHQLVRVDATLRPRARTRVRTNTSTNARTWARPRGRGHFLALTLPLDLLAHPARIVCCVRVDAARLHGSGADAQKKNKNKKINNFIFFGLLAAGKERKKMFGFRFSIPKFPEFPEFRGLRGRSHEKRKVFLA